MTKYNNNLRIDGNRVISYTTHVATIEGDKLLVHGYWSATTSKHVNMIARDRGLTKVDAPRSKEPEDNSMLKTVGLVAAMASIFTDTQKESNDWKARMLKAGLGNRGLTMPDNWDELSEDEKEKRLNAVIEIAK